MSTGARNFSRCPTLALLKISSKRSNLLIVQFHCIKQPQDKEPSITEQLTQEFTGVYSKVETNTNAIQTLPRCPGG